MHHALDIGFPYLGFEIAICEGRIRICSESLFTIATKETLLRAHFAILHAVDRTAVRAHKAIREVFGATIIAPLALRDTVGLPVGNSVHDEGAQPFELGERQCYEVFGDNWRLYRHIGSTPLSWYSVICTYLLHL
jgi:hypothetical protein